MYKNINKNLAAAADKKILSYLPVLLVGICLLLVGLYVDGQNISSLKQEAYNTLFNKVSVVRAKIEGNINSNAQIVKGLAAAISIEPNMSQERFVALSTPLMTGHSQIRNIAAAPNLVIRYMNPVAGNEAAIGLNYRTVPEQYDSIKLARDTGDLVMAGPVNLVQGGRGFIARIPVFVESEDDASPIFWGIISSVIDIDKFFTVSGLFEDSLDYDIAIRHRVKSGEQAQIIFGDDKLFNQEPILTDITLPYGAWQLAAVPKGGWQLNSGDVFAFRAILFMIALFILLPLFILGNYMQKKRESEAFLRLLFKLSPVGIALNDYGTGDFLEVSDVLLGATGYTSDEFMGLSYWDITPGKYKDEEAEQLQSLELTGEYGPYEKEYIRKDGSHYPVLLKGLVVFDSSGRKLIWSFIEDISKRKEAERSLQRSQKMDAIGHLTSGIAHDFNNIMGIILGNLELLKRDVYTEQVNALDRIDTIYKAGQRAVDLTNQLLSFSRNQPTKQLVTNINTLLEKIQNLISRSMTPEVAVSLQLMEDVWLTKINRGDFEDTVLNLCINARDAMNGHGQLIISTQNRTIDEAYSETLAAASPGEYVQITVSDSGKGIPDKKLEYIFEPFYTTKEEGKGTGLGLAMVYGFVRRSKGFIDVDSKIGVGTKIKLFLPRFDKKEEGPIESVEVKNTLPTRGSEKLLVVDDKIKLLELAKILLNEQGYQVITASNGKQALEKLRQEPDIDLLFSDVIMPGGLNGFELADKAMSEFPNLKVLLTSGNTSKAGSDTNTGEDDVKMNVLNKPYTRDELTLRVRAILDE